MAEITSQLREETLAAAVIAETQRKKLILHSLDRTFADKEVAEVHREQVRLRAEGEYSEEPPAQNIIAVGPSWAPKNAHNPGLYHFKRYGERPPVGTNFPYV